MPHIVEEGSDHGQQGLLRRPEMGVTLFKLAGNPSGNLVGPQAVGKATMLAPVKGIGGGTELFDSAEPLKFFGVDQPVNQLMLDMNVIVNRVAKYFFNHSVIIAKKSVLRKRKEVFIYVFLNFSYNERAFFFGIPMKRGGLREKERKKMQIFLENEITVDDQLEVIKQVFPVEVTEKGGYHYLTFTNDEEERVVIKSNQTELLMTRFSTPKSIMRFVAAGKAMVLLPTPMGIQHFVTQTSHYAWDKDKQQIDLHYRLKAADADAVFASYKMRLTWG